MTDFSDADSFGGNDRMSSPLSTTTPTSMDSNSHHSPSNVSQSSINGSGGGDGHSAAAGDGPFHKAKFRTRLYYCSHCGKTYKHHGCLTKHLWEHHEFWGFTKKICRTKHQQVQMLEAAQVLTDMIMWKRKAISEKL